MSEHTEDSEQIRKDMLFLAGKLAHRGAQTDEEREAAHFLQRRFREYTPNVEIDDFSAIENYLYLFASYLTEFLVVAVLAVWFPAFATVYGIGVFLVYWAEFMGWRIFSRFMPQYDSQNVIAQFMAPRPKRLVIVTAHYDSGCASPLSHPNIVPWLRRLHYLLLLCMAVIVATCATDALGHYTGFSYPFIAHIRWTFVGLLLSGALFMFYASLHGEDLRGANRNASGVAAMLRMAAHFQDNPLEETDVWLVAAGSHESWMSGLQHLLRTQKPDKHATYILNLEGVGVGQLSYLTAEGMMHLNTADKDLCHAASQVQQQFDVHPASLRAVPTAAHIPHAHGYKTLTITGLDENQMPPHWNWVTDSISAVDEAMVVRAADFSVALLTRLEDSQ